MSPGCRSYGKRFTDALQPLQIAAQTPLALLLHCVLVHDHLHLVETPAARAPLFAGQDGRNRPAGVGVLIQIEELRDVVAQRLDVHLGELSGGDPVVHGLRHQVAVPHRLHHRARPANGVAGGEDAGHVELEGFAHVERGRAVDTQALILYPRDLADGRDEKVARHVVFGPGERDRLTPPAAVVVAQTLPLQPHAGNLMVAQDRDGRHQEVEPDPFLLRALDLLEGGRHVVPFAPVHDVHLPRAQTPCGPGRIHSRVPAAHHHHEPAAEVRHLPGGDVAQHLYRVVHTPLLFPLHAQAPAPMGAQRQHYCLVTLALQALDGEVRAQFHAGPEFHTGAPDVLDLGEQGFARQAIRRDPVRHHAAGERHALEHGDLVPALRQAQGGRQPARPGADHRHFDVLPGRHLGRKPGNVEQLVRHEPLGLADSDGLVDISAATALLAESRAYPAADEGEGIGVPMDGQRLGVATLGDQREVGGNIHTGGAGAHAAGPHQHLTAGGRAAPLLDVLDELVLEVAQDGQHRRRRQLPQGAQRTLLHPLGHRAEPIEVRELTLPRGDPLQDLQHPSAPDPAGRALAAAFVAHELHEVLGDLDHAGGLVGDDHPPGTHDGARGPE